MTVKILVDSREQAVGLMVANELSDRYDVEILELRIGDYKVTDPDSDFAITIERKTAADLASSMKSGRLFTQLAELSGEELGILLVSGDAYSRRVWKNTHMTEHSVTKLFAGISVRRSIGGRPIHVLQVPSDAHIPTVLGHLAKIMEDQDFVRAKNMTLKRVREKKHDTRKYILSDMLQAFPGVGPKQAKNILEHFSWDFGKIMDASIAELKKIRGIGQVHAQRIYSVLHSPGVTEQVNL